MTSEIEKTLLFCVGCTLHAIERNDKNTKYFTNRDVSIIKAVDIMQSVNARNILDVDICKKCADYVLRFLSDWYNDNVIKDIKNAVKTIA